MKVPFGQILREKVGWRNQREVSGKITSKPYFEQSTGIFQVGGVSVCGNVYIYAWMWVGMWKEKTRGGEILSQRREVLRTVVFLLKIALNR